MRPRCRALRAALASFLRGWSYAIYGAVLIAAVAGFVVLLAVMGWHPNERHKEPRKAHVPHTQQTQSAVAPSAVPGNNALTRRVLA